MGAPTGPASAACLDQAAYQSMGQQRSRPDDYDHQNFSRVLPALSLVAVGLWDAVQLPDTSVGWVV